MLYIIMFILLALMICGFFGGYYQLSILAIFLIITGWCGVRNSAAYNIEQIMCVTMFSAYIWVYTTVDLILKLFAYQLDVEIAALISLFGGAVFYLVTCVVAKLLYDELRINYERIQDPALAGPGFLNRFMGGGASNQAQQVPDRPPSAEEVPFVQGGGNIPPNRGDRGRALGGANNAKDPQFKAFSGPAHSMSEDK